MSDEDTVVKKRRILRFIRDLDLRYIRGSIDRRTYQTLKSKYQEMLTGLPQLIIEKEDIKPLDEAREVLPQFESDFHEIEAGLEEETPIEVPVPTPQEVSEVSAEEVTEVPTEEVAEMIDLPEVEIADKMIDEEPIEVKTEELEDLPITEPVKTMEIPVIELSDIPLIEIEELKIRYVMNMAIKAATKTFEEEMNLEQEYISSKLDNQDYLKKKNVIERKQQKIFQHFYKLSELLFSVCRDHLYKNTHNNFLLFNNELSENINRLRRMETDKKELKGIIYDINDRVLRHRPILKKAAQDTLNWKVEIQQEKERFKRYRDDNFENLDSIQKEEIERKVRQLIIYEELLDEDINDYTRDLDAMNAIYGEHLRFQEIITPYFKDLSLKAEDRIQKYSEIMSALSIKSKMLVSSNFASRDINYQLLSELKSFWRYTGKPVLDEQSDLVGFLVGPGQLNDNFGIMVKQQHEISLSMVRRIYDHILSPDQESKEDMSEIEKKQFLLSEITKTIPQVPFTFLIPDVIIEYCSRVDTPLTDELKQVMMQPESFLFIPIEETSRLPREIKVQRENIMQNGEVLPYFNPTESNILTEHLASYEETEVRDIFNTKLGDAHSVIYHPDKGYFLVLEREIPSSEIYEQIYKFMYEETLHPSQEIQTPPFSEMKKRIHTDLSKEYELSEEEVGNIKFLQSVLIEKNTGLLPEKIENSRYSLISLGNVRVIGENIQVNYGSPLFTLSEIFNLEGKVVENVKGTEIGVVYNLDLKEKPVIYLWTSIDIMLIASLVSDEPEKLFGKDQNFIDNLAISIGKQLSIAPQIALRPDIVMVFMNLAGKISDIDYLKELMEKFNPKKIDLARIISVDKRKILADISDKEIMEEIYTDIEVGEIDDDHRFVTSPDYFLREQ
jgi:hypothetical protein